LSNIRAAWLFLGLLTIVRVAGLLASPVELHGDEAQYWSWSRELAWGYFSKPPLVAWAAAFTTALFGNAEWAVRLATPFAHLATALFLMAAARRRWGEEAAVWTGLLYITMPAVWLSSAILSTDAFLLLLWAGGLWAFDRYLDRQTLVGALALGLFIGVGFLAKYAMIYFVIGLAILAVVHRPSRAALGSPKTLVAAAAVLACLAPNLIWNATNGFATLSHTAANANWGAEPFDVLDQLGEITSFLVDQLGVFGPVSFVFLVWGSIWALRAPPAERERWLPLLAFALPALLVVAGQAFLSRANANWAVAAYAAATVFVVAWALDRGRRRWLAVGLAIHLAIGGAFAAAAVSPAFADRVGLANAFKRARGWEETTAVIRAAYGRGDDGEPFAAVLVDNRLMFHDVEYYSREAPLPLRMWLRYGGATSHAEATYAVTAVDGPMLAVVERYDDEARIRADFARSEPAEEVVIALGGGKERRLKLFAVEGYAPLPRGPEYEARWLEP
jgi:4-amino-4-deoxy-L-arabinose transferase-like glycosyltransferase